jgi:CO/xanthine dehydrogenase FAD-binding subunit
VGSYLRPRELDEALRALRAAPRVVLAGGTDHFPARVGRPADEDILDITAIDALKRIEEGETGWRIPALSTWSDVIATPLPAAFDGLKAAAREVGGVQIQNAGTLCGNLCNASPAADGVPCLMALDAEVELASLDGTRRLRIAEFVLGNRRTARRADELVIALHVRRPADGARGAFLKLGARRYLVISIVMAAGVIEWRDGRVAAARLAIGACAPTAMRLPRLEDRLRGVEARRLTGLELASCDLDVLAPIDDVRASAAYRTDAGLTLVRRLLAELRP